VRDVCEIGTLWAGSAHCGPDPHTGIAGSRPLRRLTQQLATAAQSPT